MQKVDVDEAIREAKRFLELAGQFELYGHNSRWAGQVISPSRKNAAIRRASLDLTNALAKMRRSQ
jgi:hypothetical protein